MTINDMAKVFLAIWGATAIFTMIVLGMLLMKDAFGVFEIIDDNVFMFLLGILCILSAIVILLIISGLL